MPYRITRRASEARQRQIEAMQRGQEAARMARPERLRKSLPRRLSVRALPSY